MTSTTSATGRRMRSTPCPLPKVEQSYLIGDPVPIASKKQTLWQRIAEGFNKITLIRLSPPRESFLSPGKSFIYQIVTPIKRYYVDVAGEFQMIGAARFLMDWTRKKP